MSNWDLMMPGMGLTSIGLAGVVISYSGIAHTFIDGMHALTGLTMFIGLIFLAAGILQGGVSTSNKAKATVLVILSISLAFGTAGLIFNTISTVPLFAGIMMIIAVPAIVIAYVSTKMPAYARPMSIIFVLAAVAGISSYTAFGYIGPSPYLVEEPVIVEPEIIVPQGPSFVISILVGSAEQGNPDYEPDDAVVPLGEIIKWSNDDDVVHTVTSTDDVGESFDSGLIAPGDEYLLDPSTLESKAYDYLCIVHPWMPLPFYNRMMLHLEGSFWHARIISFFVIHHTVCILSISFDCKRGTHPRMYYAKIIVRFGF